jgi:2-C-methyl-D-erythritol 4-phosphate cytidylyltransferase
MKVFALIMAGGSGTRMGEAKAKQSLKISGKKIFRITVDKFNSFDCIDGIVFVGRKEDMVEYKKELEELKKVIEIVEGGETRSASVYNGLTALDKHNPEVVVVHDAVRPFIEEFFVKQSIDAAYKFGAAVVAVNAVDTVAEVENDFMTKVLNRETLRNLQTPQTFRYSILRDSYEKARKEKKVYTDDTGCVMEFGAKIKIIEGSDKNFKITLPSDLEKAHFLAKG